MTRPRLLDLFCGAGGASVGYQRAGFDVTGVNIAPHPDYPYALHVTDATTLTMRGGLTPVECAHNLAGIPVGVYGSRPEYGPSPKRPVQGTSRGVRAETIGQASAAAIPPAYTHYLGEQLMEAVR